MKSKRKLFGVKSRFLAFFAVAVLAVFGMASCTSSQATAGPEKSEASGMTVDGLRVMPVARSMVSSNIFPWNNPPGITMNDHGWMVFDGSQTTMWDPYGDVDPDTIGQWILVDLGEGNEQAVGGIRFMPRSNLPERMSGAVFQASEDGINWVELYEINATPSIGWNNINIDNSIAYRYYRYYAAAAGDVVQIEYWVRI